MPSASMFLPPRAGASPPPGSLVAYLVAFAIGHSGKSNRSAARPDERLKIESPARMNSPASFKQRHYRFSADWD
jgi:hypothetical protein